MKSSLFRKKSAVELLQAKKETKLQQTISAFDLVMLGVGAIVGTGIFILPGTVAATHAGPAIIFSFIIAAIVCLFAGMCYAEFASAVPVTGSAYTYSYLVFGESSPGWRAGPSCWSTVSPFLRWPPGGRRISFPSWKDSASTFRKLCSGPFDPAGGTYLNVPAVGIILILAFLLTLGVKESSKANAVMVFIKIGVILLFILTGMFYVKPENWQPFMPFGIGGVLSGAAIVFYAYLGFDAVSSAAEEVKNPQRDMPIGIIGSLGVCALLYVAVSLVLTGIAPYTELNVANPVSYAIQLVGQNWIAGIISLGAITGMMTVILVMLYGGTRLLYSFGRDGLLPKTMSDVNMKTRTPIKSTWIFTCFVALFAGLVPLTRLAEMVNMGTLLAFLIVSIGVIFLRKNKDIPARGFKVPFYPALPVISFLLCLFLYDPSFPHLRGLRAEFGF